MMYTGYDRQVLLAIVSRMEITTLKAIVAETDKKAFVIIYDVHEVLGEGFRGLRITLSSSLYFNSYVLLI